MDAEAVWIALVLLAVLLVVCIAWPAADPPADKSDNWSPDGPPQDDGPPD